MSLAASDQGMTSEEQAFLNAIIACPEDDLPRLVFADWLEEHDQPERAEFIRSQCDKNYVQDWAISQFDCNGVTCAVNYDRGFISRVHLETLADWMGGECERCMGGGTHDDPDPDRWTKVLVCTACNGSGSVEGVGLQLCESNPVEWVGVGDREPCRYPQSDMFFWMFTEQKRVPEPPEWVLPIEVYELLNLRSVYGTEEGARADLSRALILWARIQILAKRKAEELADKKPLHASWYDDDVYSEKDDPESNLPATIFALLDGYTNPGVVMRKYWYDTEARAALQRAI